MNYIIVFATITCLWILSTNLLGVVLSGLWARLQSALDKNED